MSPLGRISSSLPPPAPGCCEPDLLSLGPALGGAETLRLIPSTTRVGVLFLLPVGSVGEG